MVENSKSYELMDHINAIVLVADQNGSIVFANKAIKTILGYKPKEVLGDGWWELTAEDNIEERKARVAEMATGKVDLAESHLFENRITTKDGKHVWTQWTNTRAPEGLLIGTAIDITEKKKLEEHFNEAKKQREEIKNALERSKSLLSEAEILTGIGCWEWDFESDIALWSDGLFNLFQLDPKDGAPNWSEHDKLYVEEDFIKYRKIVQKCLENHDPFEFEIRAIRTDGTIRHCIARGQAEKDKSDKTIRLWGTLQDITERKDFENELILAKEKAEESERLKTSFLANISHEIRTPMTGIMGFTELLKRKGFSDIKSKKYLNLIEQEGRQLTTIISDIIDLSKIDSNSINIITSTFNLNTLLDNLYSKYTISLSNSSVLLKVKKGLKDKESVVRTDSNRLTQTLSNLIENAIKFTKEGFVEFGYTLTKQELTLYVKDSGPGIEKDEQQLIFGRFTQGKAHQTHNSGSGLGLSIVKGLTNILEGSVWVESEKEKGTEFYVKIPYKKGAVEAKVQLNKEQKTIESRQFTILLAEDNFIVSMYLKEFLSGLNFTVLHAKNGEKAIKMFEENPSIDLILMDLNMPKKNGYEALDEIRKMNQDIPIIAQSGLAMSEDLDRIMKAGFNDHISKPISEKALITTINKYLNKKTTS